MTSQPDKENILVPARASIVVGFLSTEISERVPCSIKFSGSSAGVKFGVFESISIAATSSGSDPRVRFYCGPRGEEWIVEMALAQNYISPQWVNVNVNREVDSMRIENLKDAANAANLLTSLRDEQERWVKKLYDKTMGVTTGIGFDLDLPPVVKDKDMETAIINAIVAEYEERIRNAKKYLLDLGVVL